MQCAGFAPLAHGYRRARGRTRWIRRRFKSDRGAAAIEFALVFPLFVMIMFAIVQFGFVFFVWNDMTNAAREAARRLSVDETISEAQAASVAQNWLSRWSAPFNVTACKIAAETGNAVDCTGTDSVSVTVTAQISQIGPIAVDFGLAELRAFVIMRKEGAP